jgi:non-specific protein-tyrosine kinase
MLATLRTNYAALLANSDLGAANTLTVLEPASLPSQPIGPNKLVLIILSVGLAAAIAAGAGYLLEYLDDTVRTAEDVTRIMQLPTVANITRIEGKPLPAKLVTALQPRLPVSEAFRVLRTNLQYASQEAPPRTLMITSSNPQEGKSVVAANLAVVLAQAGQKVILVDADLRRPVLHQVFGARNDAGLSDALAPRSPGATMHLQTTTVENLRLLSSGPVPPLPAELLGSPRFQRIIDELVDQADIVLFDSPPVLVVADPVILSARVDGVLLVVEAGRTRGPEAAWAVEELRHVRAKLLGVALNRQAASRTAPYLYYYRTQPALPAKAPRPTGIVGPRPTGGSERPV